jgi:16S rRNA (uracil1498-N3)-methyltransferase
MRISRVYQSMPLQEGLTVSLDRFAVHHVISVLRLSVHDPLIVFNGEGGEFSAIISKISKKEVLVILETFHDVERESTLKIHLGQGISRSERMDFTIQKSVELGVDAITPLITERSRVKLSDERWQRRTEHWQRIMIQACEQCGRNRIPVLYPVMKYSVWVEQVLAPLKFILFPHAENKLYPSRNFEKEIVLLVGPEGGLSEEEERLAKQHGFQGLKLGNRVLRTETAALVAISAVQATWGDFI